MQNDLPAAKPAVETAPSPPPTPEEWVAAMTAGQKKFHVAACLDEFEAASESVRLTKGDDVGLKIAKAWGERQKKHLRILGYRKRMPVIGGKQTKPEADGGLFDSPEPEKELT